MGTERKFKLGRPSVSSSALCGALHKADYVDCTIMWTTEGLFFRCLAWLGFAAIDVATRST